MSNPTTPMETLEGGEGEDHSSLPPAPMPQSAALVDLQQVRDWLTDVSALDLDDIVADGGVTAGMVVQQEARVMAAKTHRALVAMRDLLEAVEEALPLIGWRNYSDEEMQAEAVLGNGFAPVILRARAAIAKAKALDTSVWSAAANQNPSPTTHSNEGER